MAAQVRKADRCANSYNRRGPLIFTTRYTAAADRSDICPALSEDGR
jgi:hypothetical protein